MKHTNTILLSLTVMSAASLAAQDERRLDPRAKDPKPVTFQVRDQVALTDVLGAKVRLKASAEERGEAAADQRLPNRPNGSIDDLILDSRTGQATWAIVAVGGLLGVGDKEVAVPASALIAVVAPDKAPVYDLAATEAELKALPAFDKDVMKKSGLEVALRNAETSWRQVRPDGKGRAPVDASGKRPDVEGNGNMVRAGAILGTQLKGIAVRCSDVKDDKNFGEVDNASVDLGNNTITYLVVGHGGVVGIGEKDYLVPFGAARTVVTGDDHKPVLILSKTTEEMAAAPKYTKPDKGFLTDEGARISCEFYGIEHGKRDANGDGKHDKTHDKGKDGGR